MKYLLLLISFTVSASLFSNTVCQDRSDMKEIGIPDFDDEPVIRTLVGKFFTALTALNFKEARQYAHSHEDCEKVFDLLKKISEDPDVKKNPPPTIKEIKIEKDRATVTFVETSAPMPLEKTEGTWKIHMCGKK